MEVALRASGRLSRSRATRVEASISWMTSMTACYGPRRVQWRCRVFIERPPNRDLINPARVPYGNHRARHSPAAVLMADRLAEVSDFFSVGTNDLTQYTLAVDRGNAHLADRFTPHDPAVIRQLREVIRVGTASGVPVSVCGEMASDPLMAVLLIGLGYRQLSVAPPTLLLVRWLVRQVPLAACRTAAEGALEARSATGVRAALRGIVAPFVDLRLLGPE